MEQNNNNHKMFQFTHPGKGATGWQALCSSLDQVSIHAPWEGCDFMMVTLYNHHNIVSIHAPWEGCDRSQLPHHGELRSFNSRTLGRVRLDSIFSVRFDGTVSIHAPWEGCDSVVQSCVL